jgi:hypothetical protein
VDTFQRIHNTVGLLREALDQLTELQGLNVLTETDELSVESAKVLLRIDLIEGLEAMSQRYLLEED